MTEPGHPEVWRDDAARIGRRTVLVGAGLLLGGCSASAPRPRESSSGSASAPPGSPSSRASSQTPTAGAPAAASTPSPTAAVPLPAVTAWRPNDGELAPRAKQAAVRWVERRGNRPGRALQVLDAQYGGLLPGTASVLVVTRTWRRVGGRLESGGATFDVRVRRVATGWRVTAVHPSRPGPPGPLSKDARAVLRSSRIVLPPAAAADVRSGQVHDSVLAAMRRLAERYRIGVSVVRSGHPIHVFGTDRLSDHPRGRAFDTFMLNGHLVVDPGTPRRLVTAYMEAAAAAGSYNVGGPYLLGSAPQWFSDRTHHDHVHAGFAK